MLIDITLKITPGMAATAQGNDRIVMAGHLGTHFDVMNKEFPLAYTRRRGVVFDVRHVAGRDIEAADIDLAKVEPDMFVAFCSGYAEKEQYGTRTYFSQHPQLSDALIEELVQRGISIIGIDFSGVRRGKEHTPKDQYCADRGVFIVENLCNLPALVERGGTFIANTYPMNYAEMTGLPCRVIAEV